MEAFLGCTSFKKPQEAVKEGSSIIIDCNRWLSLPVSLSSRVDNLPLSRWEMLQEKKSTRRRFRPRIFSDTG